MSDVALDFATPDVVVRVMLTANRAIDDFLGDCRARGWSERTLKRYAETLDRFADRLPIDQDVTRIQTEDVRRYRAARQGRVHRNTVACEECHLAAWFKPALPPDAVPEPLRRKLEELRARRHRLVGNPSISPSHPRETT